MAAANPLQKPFWFALLGFIVLAGLGSFINFVPEPWVAPPALIASIAGAAATLAAWWRVARLAPRAASPSTRKARPALVIPLAFALLAFTLFMVLDVTLPALATEVGGSAWKANDRVSKIEQCTGRRCAGCEWRVWLERYGGNTALCFSSLNGVTPRKGAAITVTGYSSRAGIRVKTISPG